MARGFLSGLIWGTVLSGGGLSVASLMGPQPAGTAPPEPPLMEAPEQAGATEIDEAAPDAADGGADPERAGISGVGVPQGDVSAPVADTASADRPDPASAPSGVGTPEEGAAPRMAGGEEEPVLPNPQSVAPEVPVSEADVSISTDPSQPVAPELGTESAFAEPQTPEPEEFLVLDEGALAPEDPVDPAGAPQETGTPVADETAAIDTETAAAPPEPNAPEPEPTTPEPDPAAPEPTAPDPSVESPATTAPDPGEVPEEPVIAREAGSGTEAGAPETPSRPRLSLQGGTGLPGSTAGGVTVRRPGDTETSGDEAVEAPEAPEAAPALERFAASVDAPAGLPLMSVILVDDGSMAGGAVALSSLPFPVTVALDPSDDGAQAKMRSYRAAGFEVLALARIPEGALPVDVEVNLGGAFGAIPEAIGLLDAGQGGLQSDRAVTEQAMTALASDGRGVITVSKGLNMAARAADQAGVPAGVVFRDLDAEGQDARVIRRFVDQAAFRARQESGVILLGRVRPDTISALTLWGNANRAGQVALVPVSAVLTATE